MVQTLMIIGLGDVGGNALEFLARTPSVGRIIAADYNSDWGVRKTNNAVVGAALQGFYPHIEFVKINLNDVEATAETLLKYKPDFCRCIIALMVGKETTSRFRENCRGWFRSLAARAT
jgi:tRNA A37 threonylcarbamoyladenosine dehydratase